MPDDNPNGGYYPPVSFYFKVDFPDISKDRADNSFQSVSGLSVEFETESFREGGENRFEHVLPVGARYTDLVLRRGMLKDSKVVKWCQDAFENMSITPTTVIVYLLNEKGDPVKSWNITHAWPKKWTISDFNAEENTVVIETLELSYQFFTTIQ